MMKERVGDRDHHKAFARQPRPEKGLHMRKVRLTSFLVAVVFMVGLAVPLTARSASSADALFASSLFTHAPDASRQQTGNGETSTANARQPARKSGNSLGRALGAPFRALARLFGGGKKKPVGEQAARKRETEERETARQTSRQDAAPVVSPAAQDASKAQTQKTESERVEEREKKNTSARKHNATTSREDVKTTSPVEVYGSARRLGETASTIMPRPPVWTPTIDGVPRDPLSQGRALLRHGYVNEAIAELSIAATIGPELIEANTLLGIAHDHVGMHRQAHEYYERALSATPYNAELLYNFGHSLYLVGDFNGAMKRLKTAARLSPNDPRIPYSTGLVYVRLGRYDDAFKALARGGGDFAARIKMASLLEDANRPKDAIKQYEAALRLQPTAPIALERLAELYQRTGRRNEAEAVRRNTPKPATKPVTGG